MRAEHAETLLGEHPDDGGQQSIVAGEGGATDAGQNARALGIRPQIEQRWPPHRPDQHEILAAMLAQRGDDPPGGEDADDLMRPGREHCRVGEALQPDHEHVASGGACRRGDLARQPAAAGQDAECRRPATAAHRALPDFTPRGSGRDGSERR